MRKGGKDAAQAGRDGSVGASDCALPEDKVHHAAAVHPILHLQHASLHPPDLGLRQVAAVYINQ